jgi:hypothetical protein
MSTSIFHVRPLDSGKGWAIDEYDGRGAWQHSVPIGPDGAPMDKIQAQRAVFQMRRKAVNSAKSTTPVNRDSDPETPLALIREAHAHWSHIGWPEDRAAVEQLGNALALMGARS